MKRINWVLVAVVTMMIMSIAASANTISLTDPATLHTGPGAGTACATGGCPITGGEVNAVPGNSVDIFQQSAGATTLINPWLLILGVPNVSNPTFFNSGDITSVTSINAYPGGTTTTGSATFGGTAAYGWNGQGYVGSMNSGDVYHQSFFALSGSGIDASNSFTNWSGWDSTVNGINASSFGVYVFAINAPLSGNGLTNFIFADGTLPKGTFIVGYGNDGTHVYVNPFTQAGLETGSPVPEPASLTLFGSGMLFLGGLVRRKIKK